MSIVRWDEIDNFQPYETECRCGCGRNDVSHELMLDLDEFRDFVDRPVHLNSLCRCPAHNKNEGADDTSSHAVTPEVVAVDIEAKTKRDRFKTLEFFIKKGYTRIGIAKTFIHVDLDKNKTQEISWLY